MTDYPARSRQLLSWRTIGLGFVFVWFLVGGLGHFVLYRTFVSVVPDYVPFPEAMVIFTGVCEIAGALALLHPPLRRAAGLALVLLTICVTPVHVAMLIHADQYQKLGLPLLWGRLLFQPVFAWIVWIVTKPATA